MSTFGASTLYEKLNTLNHVKKNSQNNPKTKLSAFIDWIFSAKCVKTQVSKGLVSQ